VKIDASKNIFRVYHIRIIAHTKNGAHDMKQTDSSIIIVRNVCVLASASMITRNIFLLASDIYIFFINWTVRMSDNLPKRVKSWVTRISFALHKKWCTRHETDRFLNNHCQECVRACLSIHDCLSFRHKVIGPKIRNYFLTFLYSKTKRWLNCEGLRVSEWLLFNANSAIFQLNNRYPTLLHGETFYQNHNQCSQ
jgi:hypothetical protein